MACEYCSGNKMLGKTSAGYDGSDAEIDGNELVVSGWYEYTLTTAYLYIPINYCPMCGEKLN